MQDRIFHYKIQVRSNIWERYFDQITNVGSKNSLSNDINAEGYDAGGYRCEHTFVKLGDSQPIYPNTTDLQTLTFI